jgi:NAD(P)-dependent dehydrogenase (short-subunit alcohol dehydrogenase family)
MEKKIILVTGASGGIGRVTALELAKQGHHVIVHGRSVEKTKAVCNEIISAGGSAEMFTADLSLMPEVKAFADKIAAKYDHINVLVNNAGGQFGSVRETTSEGHEKTFAINVLAPFLLTNLLLPLLKKSVSGRVVTVSSESYKMGGKPLWDDIELEKHYSLTKSYGLSKLFVWWLMRRFAAKLEKEGVKNVTVNTCEPGSAVTDLQRVSGNGLFMKILTFLWKPMMWSVEEAAATSVYLATSPEVEGVTGRFFGKCREKQIKEKWISAEGEEKIWNYCEKACREYLS